MPQVTRRRLLDQVELNDHEKKNLQILDTIRKKGPTTRAEISRLIGLNIVTVTSYVDQYIKKGVIQEVGIDVSSGGRKPTLVDLNPNTAFLVGVGLNIVDMIATLCDLKGEVAYTVKRERPSASGEELIYAMADLVEELIKKSKTDAGKIHGIGLGLPGIFNRETHSVRWPQGPPKGDLAITSSIYDIFEERFGIPAIVDKDANAAVFGEEWYGKDLDAKHVIYLYSSYGCGILINGQIYRGASGSAGEWLFDEDSGKIDILSVVQTAEGGDALANKILKEAGRRLGHKAAFLVNLFNPDILIVGGGIEAGGVPLLDEVREVVKRFSIPEATGNLRIVPSSLGESGVSLGAAAFVAQNYFVTV